MPRTSPERVPTCSAVGGTPPHCGALFLERYVKAISQVPLRRRPGRAARALRQPHAGVGGQTQSRWLTAEQADLARGKSRRPAVPRALAAIGRPAKPGRMQSHRPCGPGLGAKRGSRGLRNSDRPRGHGAPRAPCSGRLDSSAGGRLRRQALAMAAQLLPSTSTPTPRCGGPWLRAPVWRPGGMPGATRRPSDGPRAAPAVAGLLPLRRLAQGFCPVRALGLEGASLSPASRAWGPRRRWSALPTAVSSSEPWPGCPSGKTSGADRRGPWTGDGHGRMSAGRGPAMGRSRPRCTWSGWPGVRCARGPGGRPGKQADGSSKTREVKLCTVWSAEGETPRASRAAHRKRGDARYGGHRLGVRPAGRAGGHRRARPGDTPGHPGRWGALDLEPGRRSLPGCPPDRGSLTSRNTSVGWRSCCTGRRAISETRGPRRATRSSTRGISPRSRRPGSRAPHPPRLCQREAVRKCSATSDESPADAVPNVPHAGALYVHRRCEAGCKVAIGTRLKRAGMHWSVRGPTRSSPCAAAS